MQKRAKGEPLVFTPYHFTPYQRIKDIYNMLPLNLSALLNGEIIESNRIEFKSGWNPDAIYRSICAFANDLEDIGGGYIFIGVEEENGVAKRPVKGIDLNELDRIQKEMLGFNNLIEPYYAPKVYIEDIDNKKIIVIWVVSGDKRPYKAPESITAKHKTHQYYIRYNSSSIVAKGELEQELISLANKIPFDDRPNMQASLEDISMVLIRDFLIKTKSRLANDIERLSVISLLKQLDLVVDIGGINYPKNIALMMFCEYPYRFFPNTEVEIVHYPQGKLDNPDNFYEIPKIRGPIDRIINETLTYLRNNVIKETIVKQKDVAESIRQFNYPYQALEEVVVNALYHRNYQEREPVEIVIEPSKIEVISYNGPDRSIRLEDFKNGNIRSRRYKNRRLGDFLKDLKLSEGRGTGIPTIQRELKQNGSELAKFDFDEDRTFFLVEIPIRVEKLELNIRVDSIQEKIIYLLLEEEKSKKEILEALSIENNSYYFKKYLSPLLELDFIEQTKTQTNHPKQKYRLTSHFWKLNSQLRRT